jgi:hypothetical protein
MHPLRQLGASSTALLPPTLPIFVILYALCVSIRLLAAAFDGAILLEPQVFDPPLSE